MSEIQNSEVSENNDVKEVADDAMNDSAKKEPDEKATEKKTAKNEWVSMLITLAVAAAIAFFVTRFVIIKAEIPSGSMENTIMTHDRLWGLRCAYWFSDPKRGDIIIFHYPVDEAKGLDTLFIKRIIGLPGETVEIRDSVVYIDGVALEENYLKEDWYVKNDGYTFHIPEDSYLCLGDNRNGSKDARAWASEAVLEGLVKTVSEGEKFRYVSKDQIVGKAGLRYYPLDSFGIVK